MSDIVVEVNSNFQWNLIFDYDNSDNAGEIVQSVSLEMTGSYTSKMFMESIQTNTKNLKEEHLVDAEAGASYGPISATMKYGYHNTKELTDMLQNTTSTQTEETKTWVLKEIRTYTIGPHSRLCLYQRAFISPGITATESTFRTTPKPLATSELVEPAPVVYTLRPSFYIRELEVVYTDKYLDAPSNAIRDVNGGSGDINFGFGGKYVWLVPHKTTRTSESQTGYEIVIQGGSDPRYKDLAKDAKGEFRYLVPIKQSGKELITEAVLYRSNSAVGNFGPTYSGHTIDINKGREGDFLYLCWKSQKGYPI